VIYIVKQLTSKQKEFCKNVVSGMTYKDSYIKAYETKCSEQVAYNESSKLMMKEEIQKEIKRISEPLEKAYQTNVLSEREKKRAILWEGIERCQAKEDENGVARYMDILNKMDSEYLNININREENNTPLDNIDADTLKKLANGQ
jgi:phage terminase small subunit